MFCDSVRSHTIDAFQRISANADLLASYMFPSIGASEWTIEQVQARYRFQKIHFLDCGFHLLNFVNAAVRDTRIEYDPSAFANFKSKLANMYQLEILT
jgi:hypothetical protein